MYVKIYSVNVFTIVSLYDYQF